MLDHIQTPWTHRLNDHCQGKFQAIFVTKHPTKPNWNQDYCRETAPSHICNVDEAVSWARTYFQNTADMYARENVHGFYLDRF